LFGDEEEDEDEVKRQKERRRANGFDTKKLLKKMKQEFRFESDDEDERDPYGLSVKIFFSLHSTDD
jgi:hypothetical protein